MIRILLIVQQQATGLTYHRQLIPHTNLERNYSGEYEVIPCHDINLVSDEELKDFQIVSFLRIIDYQFKTQDIIYRCKKAGCKVIIDIDDYWKLHPTHELFKAYEEHKIAEQTVAGLELADYVTCTTEHFADRIRQHNTNVLVLSNSIDTIETQFENKLIESERVRLSYIAGIYHVPDARLMYEGMNEVYKTYDNSKFQFCLGGFGVNEQYKFIEQIFTNQFKNIYSQFYKGYLKEFRQEDNDLGNCHPYKRLWGTSVWQYATLYNETDICLVPLVNNKFNNCKSEIKIIEAGHFKKAVIVSNVKPYTICCNKSNSILINPSKNNEGWGVAMKAMIHNKNRREDLSESLHEMVKENYYMDKISIIRNQLYKKLCE